MIVFRCISFYLHTENCMLHTNIATFAWERGNGQDLLLGLIKFTRNQLIETRHRIISQKSIKNQKQRTNQHQTLSLLNTFIMFNLKVSNQAACQPLILPGKNSNDDVSVSSKHSTCTSSGDVTGSIVITKKQQTRAALKLIMLDDQKYQRQQSNRNFHMKNNTVDKRRKKKTNDHSQNNKLSSSSSHSVSSYSSAISVLTDSS